MDTKKTWRRVMDALTLLSLSGLLSDLEGLWSWLIGIWGFLTATQWISGLALMVGLVGGQWLRLIIRREKATRKALDAEAAMERRRTEEEAANARAKQRIRERVWGALDEILGIMSQLQDNWDVATDETWKKLRDLNIVMLQNLPELPAHEAEPWYNWTCEFHAIWKAGLLVNMETAEQRTRLRADCSLACGVLPRMLEEHRDRYPSG